MKKQEKVYVLQSNYPNGKHTFEGKGKHRIDPLSAWDVKEYAYRSLSGALSGKRALDEIRKKWNLTEITIEVVSTTLIYA